MLCICVTVHVSPSQYLALRAVIVLHCLCHNCIRCVVYLCYSSWLYQVCRGVDNDPVKVRKLAQSIGCGKNFPGKAILDSDEKVLLLLLDRLPMLHSSRYTPRLIVYPEIKS